jgi:hypothetical protein
MEAATLCLLLTFIFLGLMNPTDLSLAVLDSNGALDLPHDTTITVGAFLVCLNTLRQCNRIFFILKGCLQCVVVCLP